MAGLDFIINVNGQNAQNNLRRLNMQFNQMNTDANRTGSTIHRLGKSLSGLNGILGMATGAFAGLNMARAIQSAMQMIEVTNLFAVSLGEATAQSDAFAMSLSNTVGLDLTNIKSAIGTFALLGRSMGINTENSAVLSQNMYKLGLDLSSLMNVPINQVMADLRSGLIGQSETVYKYGIDVTEASIKAEAMNQGIEKSVRNMSQGEKMALRYSVMLKQTALAQTDFARTLESPANQMRILSERMVTLTRTIGTMFIPALTVVLPYLNAFVKVLTEAVAWVASLLGYKAPTSKGGLGGVASSADEATDSLGGVSKAIKNLQGGFDELNVLDTSKLSGGSVGVSVGDPNSMAFDGYNNGLEAIRMKSDEIKDKMDVFFQGLYKTLKEKFDIMKPEVLAFYNFMLEHLAPIGRMFTELKTAYKQDPESFIKILKVLLLLATAFTVLTTAIEVALIVYEALIITFAVLETAMLVLGAGLTFLMTPIGSVIGIIALLTIGVGLALSQSEDFKKSMSETWSTISKASKDLWDNTLKPFFKDLKEGFLSIYEKGVKPFMVDFKIFFDKFAELAGKLIQLFLKDFMLKVIADIKDFTKGLKSILEVLVIIVPPILKLVGSILTIFGGLFDILRGIILFMEGDFENGWKAVWEGLRTIAEGIINAIASVFEGIINTLITLMEGLVNSGINALNSFVSDVNKVLDKLPGDKEITLIPKVDIPTLDVKKIPIGTKKNSIVNPAKPYQPQQYATGGFPVGGELFIAREAGAEMVGSLGGKTAVVNNDQIVEAVSAGVAQAVASVMGNGGQTIDVNVSLDGDTIYRNQQSVARKRGVDFGLGAFAR